MANIGLSKPYIATYKNTSGTVTYTARTTLGKYTNIDISLDATDDNILYADNGPAETDSQFAGGTVTVTTDDIDPSAFATAMGITPVAIATTVTATSSPNWMIFDDDQAAPYFALAGIIKKMVGGVYKYQAFVLEKVRFKNPDLSLATQGETIEWQTPELEATILRSDAAKHPWYRITDFLGSEADAVAIIEDYLTVTNS
jgi:phi13 family phage major tail protein